MATDLMTIAASGVRAARTALDVTAQNIANADTPGYVRRSVNLAELASAGGYNRVGDLSFSGVRIAGLERNADSFRMAQVRRTGSDANRASTELSACQDVESALEQSGLFPAMTGLETALQRLAGDPVDPALRGAALESARTLAQTFNMAATSLDGVAGSLRFAAADGVAQVNRLAGELARVNLQLPRTMPGTADQIALLDQRDSLLGQMAGYADIGATIAPDQTVTVRIGGSAGPLLVSRASTSPLAMNTAADGTVSFALAGGPLTLSGGSLAGQAQGLGFVRDARTRLDALANDLAAVANASQAGSTALDGSAGLPLFSGSGAAGIALALSSGAQLATAPAGAPSGSRDPAGLAALRGALSGSDFAGQVDAMLFQVSSATQGRKTTSDALSAMARSARTALEAQAGVDLDAEAVNLVRFQQAFQASSKAIQVASDMFDTLLAIR